MYKLGIFWGSNTGNTEKIAYIIYEKISKYYNNVNIFNISNVSLNDFFKFNFFILGTSTWYYGELQNDWNNFLLNLKKLNFNNKIVSLFGCGDQKNYYDSFCNGVKILYDIVYKNGAKIIGY